ncbi:hypothetical protein ACFQ1Q_04585 [Winogradskyella litorisediminis]|uniref:Lipoprotein n=1 Tax=Winogradskyella litorisediminis TaxID=1156618 RepID=A0ABW3N6H4_9FLAO
MKKFLLLFVTLAFLSCDLEGNNPPNFQSELMFITGVNIPDEFTFGETYEITVNYTRPNDCYEFNNFIFQSNGNTRTVAVVDNVYNEPDCSVASVQAEVSFDFRVISNDTYIFQFFQGTTQNGEDDYLIIEVPVTQ